MAAKRIYQLAKEFERDEKEIIEFLIGQGIKVANRLSAVSEDTYNMLKVKYTAPPPEPEPEPVPEPEPAPVVESPALAETTAPSAEQVAPAKKKKKKKKKSAQPAEDEQDEEFLQDETSETPVAGVVAQSPINAATQAVYRAATASGNLFVSDYNFGLTKKQLKANKLHLSRSTDTWALLQEIKFDYPETSPVRYWQAVNKLTTKAFKLINEYGLTHKEILAEMRDLMMPLGSAYEPKEIFTDAENSLFEEQQKKIFVRFGHGMGKVNDNLFALKMHAERMKARYEFMDFVEHITNPNDALRSKDRVSFDALADEIAFNISGIVRRVDFYRQNKELIINIIKNFFEWRDGYATLKEQGAPIDKLQKYLELEKKFLDLVDFFSFDNLIKCASKKNVPFETALKLLNGYRDNLDDPDAKRNFQYKVRGITQLIYKPKEFIFLYQFAGLETGKDYRPPEEIAAAEAAKAAQAAAEAEVAEEKENPADSADEVADE